MLPTPTIVVNVKTYPQGTGDRLDDLLDRVPADDRIVWAVQAADLPRAAARGVPVLAQHVDPEPLGSHTGATSPEAVHDAGAQGSIVNHAERKIGPDRIEGAVRRLADLGLTSVVCADSVSEARDVAALEPGAVAIEPPELIGGDVSVTSADPEIVRQGVEAVHDVAPDVDVLCGAGVKTGDDVRKALELGTEGVLLASGLAKADDPGKVAEDLLGGLAP